VLECDAVYVFRVCFAGAVGEMSGQVTAACASVLSATEMSRQSSGPTCHCGARVWNANRKADGLG